MKRRGDSGRLMGWLRRLLGVRMMRRSGLGRIRLWSGLVRGVSSGRIGWDGMRGKLWAFEAFVFVLRRM